MSGGVRFPHGLAQPGILLHTPLVTPGQNPVLLANAESTPRSDHSLAFVPNRCLFKTGLGAWLTLSVGKFTGSTSPH